MESMDEKSHPCDDSDGHFCPVLNENIAGEKSLKSP
jgi:hypothetical protein